MKLTGWQKCALGAVGVGALLVVGGYVAGADWLAMVARLFAGAFVA